MRTRPRWWRTALAAVVMVLVCALILVDALAGGRVLTDWGLLLAVCAALAAGAWSGTLATGAAVLVGAALLTVASQVADPGAYGVADDVVFSLVVLGAPALLGAGWAARGRQVRELRRLHVLRAQQVAAQVETARIAETNRIAAMVQAGVVQTLGAILVRAEGALRPGTIATDPTGDTVGTTTTDPTGDTVGTIPPGAAGAQQRAAAQQVALTEIEQSARDALDQLRGHIGTLRETSGGPAPTLVDTAPRPSRTAGPDVGTAGPDVGTAGPDVGTAGPGIRTARDDGPRPGTPGAVPGARPPLAPVDLLAALSAVPISVEVAVTDYAIGPAWAAVLAPLVLAWPLAQRRRRPVVAVLAWCTLALAISLALVPLQELVSTILPIMLVGFAVGAGLRSWAGRLGCLALLVAGSTTMIAAAPGGPDQEEVLATALVLVLATGAGTVSAAGAARVQVLDDLVRTVELHRPHEIALAVARQRQAVARDLHDSVAASATIICLQAGAAQAVPDEEVVQEALQTVVATARDGIREVRTSLDLVDDQGVPAAPGGVVGVVAVARRAGLDVHLRTPVPVLPGPTEEVVVRVVREAVVNAARHAPGARVEVSARSGADGLVVSVSDDGAAPGLGAGRERPALGTGTGLAGLAARAALHGGTLLHGPLHPRGYAVRLHLPQPHAEAAPADRARMAGTARDRSGTPSAPAAPLVGPGVAR